VTGRFTPYGLLLPALAFTALILGYPLIQNVVNSLQDLSLMSRDGDWLGLRSYQ